MAPEIAAPLVIPPQQARSRLTVQRLLDAAEAVLAEHGPEGATVPRIAQRAGMSVGIVYRRFRDKDALLRAAYERFFERALEASRSSLDPERWADSTAREIVSFVVGGMVGGHTQHRALLHALLSYADLYADEDFRARIEELNADSIDRVIALLSTRKDASARPDLPEAIHLALVVVAATLSRWVRPGSERVFPYADAHRLSEELTEMVCAYLGVE